MRDATDAATIWNNGDDVDEDDDDGDDVLLFKKRSLSKLFQQKLYHLFNVNAAIVVCVS